MNIVFSFIETSIDTLVTYPNIVGERIAIKEGDKIGWYETYISIKLYTRIVGSRRGRDHMLIGFTTTYASSAYYH